MLRLADAELVKGEVSGPEKSSLSTMPVPPVRGAPVRIAIGAGSQSGMPIGRAV